MNTVTATSAPPTCDGHASTRAAGDWGFANLPCNATLALTTFVDRQGKTRRGCNAHLAQVKRRFGVAIYEGMD